MVDARVSDNFAYFPSSRDAWCWRSVAPRANVRMETVKDLEALADAQKIPMGCAPAATHACIPHTLAT